MKILRWLDKNLEEKLMALSLWAIVIIMGIQIIMRYVFSSSLSWSEEVSRYLFVWLAFIGISYGIKTDTHMRIDILENYFPKLEKPFEALRDIAYFGFCTYMIGPGIATINTLKASGQTSPAARIPMYIVYSGLLIGLILSVIRIVQKYVLKLMKKKSVTAKSLQQEKKLKKLQEEV